MKRFHARSLFTTSVSSALRCRATRPPATEPTTAIPPAATASAATKGDIAESHGGHEAISAAIAGRAGRDRRSENAGAARKAREEGASFFRAGFSTGLPGNTARMHSRRWAATAGRGCTAGRQIHPADTSAATPRNDDARSSIASLRTIDQPTAVLQRRVRREQTSQNASRRRSAIGVTFLLFYFSSFLRLRIAIAS